MVSAVRPCFNGFRRILALPSGVRGPLDFWALRRLAAICFGVDIGSSAFRMAGGAKVLGVVSRLVWVEALCLYGVGDFLICCDWGIRLG